MDSARDRLFALEQFGIKLGLDQIRGLLAALDHPERAFLALTVAGTNGKGSVTAMLERALRAAGYRTGRFTSPHLVHLEERFAIDGATADSSLVDAVASSVLDAGTRLPAPPTFFEATTAMALEMFRRAGVHVAVLEVGLGGRLDATNAVDSMGVAITAIAFDHEQHLGGTLPAIAGEKAAVIKPGAVVVLGPNPPEVIEVVRRRVIEVGATLSLATDTELVDPAVSAEGTRVTVRTPHRTYDDLHVALAGRHQLANVITAVRLLEELSASGRLRVPSEAIRVGVEQVVWPARLERLTGRGVEVLIDGAHNPAGAAALASYVRETYGRALPMVVGIMRDKDLDGMIAAFAQAAAGFYFTAPDSARAARPADLVRIAREVAPTVPAVEAATPAAAVQAAALRDRPVVVAGSLYLAGEVRGWLT